MKVEKVLAGVLAIALAVSLFFNAYLYLGQKPKEEEHSSTFFSFSWDRFSQKLLNETLYLNLTFDIVNENLTVKAEVYLGYYDPYATLALQFDSDNNGTLDICPSWLPYIFYERDRQFFLRANNNTRPSYEDYWRWDADGTIGTNSEWSGSFPYETQSPFHYCVYENGTYTFHFSFPTKPTFFNFTSSPLSLFDGEHAIRGKLVRVLFGIVPWSRIAEECMTVYVPPFKFME